MYLCTLPHSTDLLCLFLSVLRLVLTRSVSVALVVSRYAVCLSAALFFCLSASPLPCIVCFAFCVVVVWPYCRTLYMDIVIGLLQKVQRKRKDLRIIVASATMDAEAFRGFFNDNTTGDPFKDTATILSIEGRTYPVEVFYVDSPAADYLASTVETAVEIHLAEGSGDILAFLTGQDEVRFFLSLCFLLLSVSFCLSSSCCSLCPFDWLCLSSCCCCYDAPFL